MLEVFSVRSIIILLQESVFANNHKGSVAEGILNPDDKRPEQGYEFQAPGPGDSRGACPGLNLLA